MHLAILTVHASGESPQHNILFFMFIDNNLVYFYLKHITHKFGERNIAHPTTRCLWFGWRGLRKQFRNVFCTIRGVARPARTRGA